MEKAKLEIPIAGVPEEVEIQAVDIDKLVLDEENPRIGFYMDNLRMDTEEVSQEDLQFALTTGLRDEYHQLKKAIETNEGLIHEISIYPIGDDIFKVIDGNTRVLIYRDLRKKYPQKETWRRIRSRIFPADISDKTINMIRLNAHLRGVNDWQTYERARLLYILWEHKGYPEEELKNATKLSLAEIRKWREAYKNMNEQFMPLFGDDPEQLMKFSYFVEYENKKIKDSMRRYGLTIRDFCNWVGTGEIRRAMDVRHLQKIFENDHVSSILKENGFAEAERELVLSSPAYGSRLFDHIQKCVTGLREMTRSEESAILEGEEPAKKQMILDLFNEVEKFVKMIEKQ